MDERSYEDQNLYRRSTKDFDNFVPDWWNNWKQRDLAVHNGNKILGSTGDAPASAWGNTEMLGKIPKFEYHGDERNLDEILGNIGSVKPRLSASSVAMSSASRHSAPRQQKSQPPLLQPDAARRVAEAKGLKMSSDVNRRVENGPDRVSRRATTIQAQPSRASQDQYLPERDPYVAQKQRIAEHGSVTVFHNLPEIHPEDSV